MPSPGLSLRASACAAAACAASVLLPQAADAGVSNTPPTNSAVREFVESLPYGAGALATNDLVNARPIAAQSKALSPRTKVKLQSLGLEGQATQLLAEVTALPVGRPLRRTAASTSTGNSPSTAVLDRIAGEGPGGMGVALALALGLGALAVIAGTFAPIRR